MYVYVIKSKIQKKWIKIGSTANLEDRLKSIRNGSAGGDSSCDIIFVIETAEHTKLEKYLHNFFDKHNRKHQVSNSETNYITHEEWFDRRILNRFISLISFFQYYDFHQIKNIIFEDKDFYKGNKSTLISFIDIEEGKYLTMSIRRKIFIETTISDEVESFKNATLSDVKKTYRSLNKFMKNFKEYIPIKNEIDYSLRYLENGISDTFNEYQELCNHMLIGNIEKKYLLLKDSGVFSMIFYFEYIGLYLHKARREATEKTITSKEKKILTFCLKYRNDILFYYKIILNVTQFPIMPNPDKNEVESIYQYRDRMRLIEVRLKQQLNYLPIITALLTDIGYFEKRGLHIAYGRRSEWYSEESLRILDDIEI